MRSITIAVIFSGLLSYGTIYTQQAEPPQGTNSALAIETQSLTSEPDDEEDSNRVTPRKKTSNITLRRAKK